MEITSPLRNLPRHLRVYLIPLILILIWLTLLAFGTLSILYVKNSDDRYLLIRLFELRQLINKSEVQSVHYICKDELPTFEPVPNTWMNFGKSSNQKRTTFPNSSSMIPFITLQYEPRTTHFSQSCGVCHYGKRFSRTELGIRQSIHSLSRFNRLGIVRFTNRQSHYKERFQEFQHLYPIDEEIDE